MPSRRSLPTLSIFSRNSAPVPNTVPATPPPTRVSSAPITPPARLHLRNLLPASPDGMPTPPPPPRTPFPWVWQCHSCSTIYRMACTRRCLVCDHEYCVTADMPKRGKKRRRPSGVCASEFDYNGWADWGAWRRKVLGLEVTGPSKKTQREKAFAARTHNCMIDCDYPSECHHERYRLQTEALRRKLLDALPEEPRSPPIVASAPLSPDDELPLDEAIKAREHVDENDEMKSPVSPKSPLRQTSFFFFEDPDEVDAPEAEEEEEEEQANDEGHKKRKTDSPESGQGLSEQDEVSYYTVDTEDPDELLRRLIEEDEKMMPLELLEANALTRCPSRMENHDPKQSNTLTVRNLADADNGGEWDDDSSDSDSDTTSSLSPTSSSGSDGEWLSASEKTCASENSSIQADEEESDNGELDALVAARISFLRD